jgi:triacylglycerol lipase
VVFAHGLGGFDELFGVLPYWWRVREALEAEGVEVDMPALTPLHSVAHRAAELRDAVNRFTSGRVHIIGHSMGGIDARYLVSRLGFGERVASVTTIGSPHRGTTLADLALAASGPDAYAAADLLLRALGYSLSAVRELSVANMRDVFNPQTPDDPRVRYFAYGGRADPLGRSGNILAPYFVPTWAALHVTEGDNDGLVSVSSSRWGEYRGTLTADHLDEIGWLFGITDHFDHLELYRGIARDLRALGL